MMDESWKSFTAWEIWTKRGKVVERMERMGRCRWLSRLSGAGVVVRSEWFGWMSGVVMACRRRWEGEKCG